ncbi:MAG TPA: amino acid adenylation domain-containing protein, partial [Blastocatellia bacterium]|nr:amino acid adenylation domain-containing protein [Blastocatellia bacterium]
SAAYNVAAAVRLRGRLDLPALQSSFDKILRRQQSLRTSFALDNGQLVRRVEDYKPFRFAVEDFTADEGEREARLWELARDEARQPFALSQPPLWRLRLVRLKADEHVLLLTLHHIICDGWSLGVFVGEMARFYAENVNGGAAQEAELELQHGDYAAWQREQMASGRLDGEVRYWREQLGGELPVLSLPTDRPRPAVQTHQGGSVGIEISRDLQNQLLEMCRREGATLFMCLLAGFDVLLHRYSAQDDILVGVPVANRTHRGVEGLIGLFTNTLVMRMALRRSATFRELLRQVRAVALGAYAHQEIPFEKVVESVRPERALSHAPLFQVAFTVQNMPLPALELAGLTLQFMDVDNQTAKFDLTLVAEETDAGLSVAAQYNADLFDEVTAVRMLNHYAVLLQSCAANADEAIGDLPLLTAGERRRMLDEWNATRVDYPLSPIHEVIQAQACRTPDAVAVCAAGEQVSYAELNRRANRLAHYLRGQGVRPEARVGVCLERGVKMVVALLGVLKAGGAYVPLDPAYPTNRLEYILQDAQASVLLTEGRFHEGLPESNVRVVYLDRIVEELGHESTADPTPLAVPGNLAYIIYTSGSTGQPKGVEVAHAGLVNLCDWHQRTYGIGSADRVSLAAGLIFDALVWELWSCLMAGASLQIPDEATRLHPAAFVEWLIAETVTVSFLPTPMAEVVLDEPRLGDTRLRYLLTGGDQLSRWAQPEHRFSLVNHYGLTESTVVATSALIETPDRQHGNPSIGKPIANTTVYVLDARLNPVAIGVTGELVIAGDGLARGYAGRADSTAERFLPNPFSRTSGARLYRTGDFVRYLPDGDLAYLGRDDDQVKIRGCRVGLREVEAALSRSDAVAETVVVVRDNPAIGKQLIAYAVPRAGQSPTAEGLRNELRQRLPAYMTPSAVVLLDRLPLTANGKVDRRRLPEPDDSASQARGEFIAPTTKLERVIAATWQETLGVERVGVDDNLFDLGGHSLLLVRIHDKMRAALGREFPIIKLFEFPTIRSIAEHLSEKADAPPAQSENLDRGRARRESLAGRARRRIKDQKVGHV